MRKFLTAEWRDLIMANYEVDPALLAGRVPPGTELDLHEGRCFVSLVGFMFLNTRVLGMPIPFHVNFEEVNLRFYVKREMPNEVRRGVCFVKEIVPRWAISYVARTFYGEPYEPWRMNNSRSEREVSYVWSRDGSANSLAVAVGENLGVPDAASQGEFIIEHYWGYTSRGAERTDEYKVEHPKWELRKVEAIRIDVDFEKVYGSEFGHLSTTRPHSVLFAAGSRIAVYKGSRLLGPKLSVD
ncbi:MAG TPA: DUF2071 domain-containing protein [Pyrinomonadaceae bacterium]|nr:DUF2071 domain-containing protein [Pyrinomonadaceae bacterium]